MKLQTLNVAIIGCLLIFTASAAHAEVISFGDTSTYWPGWAAAPKAGQATNPDNTKDTIGTPNFTGGTATIINHLLTQLTFNRTTNSDNWTVLSAGDLFIDLGGNQSWDYVVDLTDWDDYGPTKNRAGTDNKDPAAGYYNLYAVTIPLGTSADKNMSPYMLSGLDGQNGWSGYNIRDNHPVALKNLPTSSVGSVYFSGWNTKNAQGKYLTSYTFDFGKGLDLGTSGDAIISWMPNCANDVVYEKVHYTVPEPTTLSLLGLGLPGLFFRRKKKA